MNPWHLAVADGLHPYWCGLLARTGVRTRVLGEGTDAGAIAFLPDDAGLRSPAVRRAVAALRQRGRPVLAGPQWGAALGVPVTSQGTIGFTAQVVPGVAVDGPAPLLVLPLPTAQALGRPRAAAAVLGSGTNAPIEVVAEADHGGVRRCIEAGLRALAFAVGEPFVHQAHLPHGHDGALAIRIDADSHRADATRALLLSLANARLRSTWFLDVERHLQFGGLDGVPALVAAGHEVQSHAFRHYTYRSFARNHANLQRSLDVLRGLGLGIDAAAAPFGTWNDGFDRALRACGLQWSSEFARAHDDVPGAFGGTSDEPWQVPVHPVCPALLYQRGVDTAGVHAWFLTELRQCLARGEPAVFYGHPIDDLERCPELLPMLAAEARRSVRSLWQPTLGELHRFARARAAAPCEVRVGDGEVRGEIAGPAPLWIERQGEPPIQVTGAFAVPLGGARRPLAETTPTYRSRVRQRRRLHTQRLAFARWLREVRR